MALQFGVFDHIEPVSGLGLQETYNLRMEQIEVLDKAGYYAYHLAEHHTPAVHSLAPSQNVFLAAVSQRTTNIRFGPGICVLPLHHPVQLIEEYCMLDHLSGGRLEIGVGRGGVFEAFFWGQDSDVEANYARYRETLSAVQNGLSHDELTHHGEFYNFDELQCFPNPIQKPGPVIYVAALSPPTIEWAAQNGYPVLADQFSPVARLAKNRQLYLETAAKTSGDPGIDPDQVEIPTLRQVYVGETMKKAREEAAIGLLWYYRSLARVGSPAGKASDPLPENYSFYRMFGEDGFNPDKDPEGFLEFLFDECTIIGDAAYCRDRVAQLNEEIGLEHVICWQNFGGLSHEQTLASQKRLIEDVAPAFA